ncbi:MAG: aminotransferase class I/II-fold pyridoxal phosphate-dependent enzyme [Methylococcales bacterium]
MSSLSSRMQSIQPFHVMSLLRRSKELEQKGCDIVHMEIGEPDFPTPPRVVDAGIRALAGGNIKYTIAAGLPELREAIAEYYRVRYRVEVSSKRIFVTPGGSGALLLAIAMQVNRRVQILMADPCYPCNRNLVSLFDGDPRLIPVGPDRNYQLDLGCVETHWASNSRGVLIASPSNPAGTLIDPEEFKAIIDFVEKKDGFVISDEIYHGLHYDAPAVTALQFSDSVVVVNSFSKYFGMTGWRLGWLIVPDRSIEAVEKLVQNIFISAPAHSQLAALAAFDEDTIRELERRREAFRERRDFVIGQLTKIGFDIPVTPEGAFYIYAGCQSFSANSFEFADFLLERHGVAITPGRDFGIDRPECQVRFAYTTSMDRLAEGMNRIRDAVRQG